MCAVCSCMNQRAKTQGQDYHNQVENVVTKKAGWGLEVWEECGTLEEGR